MKIKEIREKTGAELEKNLAELGSKLTKSRFEVSAKQAKNNREIRKIKKDIARINTVLKEANVK